MVLSRLGKFAGPSLPPDRVKLLPSIYLLVLLCVLLYLKTMRIGRVLHSEPLCGSSTPKNPGAIGTLRLVCGQSHVLYIIVHEQSHPRFTPQMRGHTHCHMFIQSSIPFSQ